MELVHALHSQWLNRSDNETIRSFRRAWRASEARAQGRRLPRGSFFPFGLDYRRAGHLARPVRTYLDTFGRDRVLVLLLDDLRRDSDAFYRQVTDFLDLPAIPSKPDPVNPNLRRRSRWLRWVLRSPPRWIAWPARLLPRGPRMRLARALTRWNTRKMHRPPLSRRMEEELHAAFDDDVRELQEIIGRDLSHWAHGPGDRPW